MIKSGGGKKKIFDPKKIATLALWIKAFKLGKKKRRKSK